MKRIADPLRGSVPEDVLDALVLGFHRAVYGEKADSRDSRQVLLLGEPELDWLRNQAAELAAEVDGDPDAAADAVAAWSKRYRANIAAMRAQTAMPGGIVAALFGRMGHQRSSRQYRRRRFMSRTPLPFTRRNPRAITSRPSTTLTRATAPPPSRTPN